MKSKLSKSKAWMAALAMALVSFSSLAAETWKYAIEEVPGSIMDAYAQEFKRRIEKATQGDVQVRIYHMGQLGTSAEMVEQAIDGTLNFVNVAVGGMGTLVPESQVFLMNYVLPDNSEVVNKVLASGKMERGPLGAAFLKKGLRLQALYSEGPQVWTTSRLVRKPADFKGFKMRVMVSPVLLDAYADLGASPTPMPFGEVYGALQLKQVDGQVNPVPAIEEMKFYEVTNYMIWAGEQELVTGLVSGGEWFKKLPPQRQKLVDDTIAGMHGYVQSVVKQFNTERLQKIKAAKPGLQMVELSPAEKAEFRKASQASHAKFEKRVGADGKKILDSLLAEVAAAR